MKTHIIATLISTATALTAGPTSIEVGVKEGWFMVNGERFFVKGIGYELGGGRGGIPWERTFDRETMEYDLALLRKAGFNTVRSWNPYSVEELTVLRKQGMMVIQGSWFSFDRYLREEAYAQKSREELAKVIRTAKQFDNILFHTIANEPHADTLIKAGLDSYYRACKEMKVVARKEDPDCLVTYSHCSRNEFLDQSMWDVIFFNDYMYAPNTVSTALKYRGHVEWLMEKHAAGKPFVIGEFGLSVSKNGQGKMGYGGNTLKEQRDGDLHMYQSMIDAGAQGGCLFMWKDGWWKHGDKMTHDDHAEEWYGVLGIEDWESDSRGTPRPVYYAFREYNQAIVAEPRQMVVYPGEVPVEVFVTEHVTGLRCCIDGGQWIEMTKSSPSWWTARFKSLTKGRHTVMVEARLALEDLKEIRRTIDVVVGDPERALPRLTLTTDKGAYEYGETAVAHVRATAGDGSPLPGVAFVGTYQDHGNRHGHSFEGKTNAQGLFETSFPLFCKPTFVTLAVGADTETHDVPHRLTDATIIEVTGLPRIDIERAAAREGRVIAGLEYGTKAALERALGRVLSGAARYTADRETANVKEGSSALKLSLAPSASRSWGYTEIFFESVKDISGDKAISFWLHGDGSGHSAKVMLIDKDGERWFDEPVPIRFKGWQRIIFSPKAVQRDPFDGIKDGDGRPNPDRLAGLAFVMTSENRNVSTIIVDRVTAHE